jgi:hypothetical protein
LKSLRPLAATGLLRVLKPLLLKSPPFYYYRDVPARVIDIVWQHLNRPGLVDIVAQEYALAHDASINAPLQAPGNFPAVPLRILFHERTVLVDEIHKYGGLSRTDAETVDQVWKDIVREYLTLSPHSRWIAVKGGHFIHMGDPDAVIATIEEVVGNAAQERSA